MQPRGSADTELAAANDEQQELAHSRPWLLRSTAEVARQPKSRALAVAVHLPALRQLRASAASWRVARLQSTVARSSASRRARSSPRRADRSRSARVGSAARRRCGLSAGGFLAAARRTGLATRRRIRLSMSTRSWVLVMRAPVGRVRVAVVPGGSLVLLAGRSGRLLSTGSGSSLPGVGSA
jgi:hypothetical protein